MNAIIERYRVRQAVEHELREPQRSLDDAIEAAAGKMAVPVEYVREAVQLMDGELIPSGRGASSAITDAVDRGQTS